MTTIEWGFVVALGSIVLYFLVASVKVYPFRKKAAVAGAATAGAAGEKDKTGTSEEADELELRERFKRFEAMKRFSKPLEQLTKDQLDEVSKMYDSRRASSFTKVIRRLANLPEAEFQKLLAHINKNDANLQP